jgi:hypothetical protein
MPDMHFSRRSRTALRPPSPERAVGLIAERKEPDVNAIGPRDVRSASKGALRACGSAVAVFALLAGGATTRGPIAPTNGVSIPNQSAISAGTDGLVYFNFTARSVNFSRMACWPLVAPPSARPDDLAPAATKDEGS